jgi:hypothetical protein
MTVEGIDPGAGRTGAPARSAEETRMPVTGTSRRKSEPALASQATSGFLFVQQKGLRHRCIEVAGPTEPPMPAWSRRAERSKRVDHAFKTGMRSKLARLHGEIEFLEPAIGRMPGRHSGVIAEQSCWFIHLKDLPRRTRSTTEVHGDSNMPAHREMTGRIIARDPAASDGRPGLSPIRHRESSSVMLRLLCVEILRRPRHEIRPGFLLARQPMRAVIVKRYARLAGSPPAALNRLKSPRRGYSIPPKIRTCLGIPCH